MLPRSCSGTRHRFVLGVIACSFLLEAASSATLPTGFSETRIVSGITNPTAMTIAPDGRIFIAEQSGSLRVVRDGALLAQPFLTLNPNSLGERGLLGVALDPNFSANGYVYVFYTSPTAPPRINRVSRFTASTTNPDMAATGSELPLLDLSALSTAYIHNGGALHFGPDGRLYIATGDNADSSNAQSLANSHGKILRINADGSIPADNPFLSQTTGVAQSIWALGLRNPYTFAFDATTGRLHVNDVGQDAWEEVNEGIAGANFGWPMTEGSVPPGIPGVSYPLYAYENAGSSCSIIGAAFYRSAIANFPEEYEGRYFFGDYCGGFIRTLSAPSYSMPETFATGVGSLVDLDVAPDGSLYYLQRNAGGELYRVTYSATSPGTLFHDSFDTVLGWVRTPGGINTAMTGLWQRGDPQPTFQNGVNLQPDTCYGATGNCMVTGLLASVNAGVNDVDNGLASVQSPAIELPSSAGIQLTFRYYLGYIDTASSADYFRVRVVGSNSVPTTVFQLPASSANTAGVWRTQTVNLTRFAGQTITLRFEAADSVTNGGTVIEAGFDEVSITRN